MGFFVWRWQMKNILHFESMIRAKVRGISQCAYSVPCTQILDCQYKMCAKRANKRLIKLLAASNVSHWVYGESLKHLAAVILRANLKKKKNTRQFCCWMKSRPPSIRFIFIEMYIRDLRQLKYLTYVKCNSGYSLFDVYAVQYKSGVFLVSSIWSYLSGNCTHFLNVFEFPSLTKGEDEQKKNNNIDTKCIETHTHLHRGEILSVV